MPTLEIIKIKILYSLNTSLFKSGANQMRSDQFARQTESNSKMAGYVKGGSVISIIIILAAYYYKRQSDEALQQHLQEVLSGLLRAEEKVSLPEQPKVAVGFGACQDIFSDAMEVLDKLGATPPEDPKHFNQITSMEDLERGFAYFFRHGAAAE